MRLHLITNKNGFNIRKTGAKRAIKSFKTYDEAIDFGRNKAEEFNCELVIHDNTGQVIEVLKYE